MVTVAPITHAAPPHPDSAVEIPIAAKARLGLDGQRSWIVAADLNRFIWPGADLRPVKRGSASYAYGLLRVSPIASEYTLKVYLAKVGVSPHHPLHLLPRRSPGEPGCSRTGRRPAAARPRGARSLTNPARPAGWPA